MSSNSLNLIDFQWLKYGVNLGRSDARIAIELKFLSSVRVSTTSALTTGLALLRQAMLEPVRK